MTVSLKIIRLNLSKLKIQLSVDTVDFSLKKNRYKFLFKKHVKNRIFNTSIKPQ